MRYCLAALSEVDARLQATRRLLIVSDFDGSLCPIADSPEDVYVAPAMLETVRRLARCQRITLAVISGRAVEDVSKRLPVNITFSGNHGLEIRGCGLNFEHPRASEFRSDIIDACASLADVLRGWSGAWVEDKRLSATVHYRKVEPRQHNSLLFAVRQSLRPFGTRLAYRAGNLAFEVRPGLPWNKGAALSLIRERSGPFDACICIGDDRTDETMFHANPDGLNIKVRCTQPTNATHYLSDPGEVALFLSHVLDLCEFRNSTDAAPVLAMGVGVT